MVKIVDGLCDHQTDRRQEVCWLSSETANRLGRSSRCINCRSHCCPRPVAPVAPVRQQDDLWLFVAMVSWTVQDCFLSRGRGGTCSRGAGSEVKAAGRRKRKKGPAWTAAGRRVNRDNFGRVKKEVVSKSKRPQSWSSLSEGPTTTSAIESILKKMSLGRTMEDDSPSLPRTAS